IEDEGSGRSVAEISAELIEKLIERIDNGQGSLKRQILVIDDCQWMDQSTVEILKAFIDQLKLRAKVAKQFKILLLADNVIDSANASQSNTPYFYNWIQNEKNSDIEQCQLRMNNPEEFVKALVSMQDFRIFEQASVFTFAPLLKSHVLQVCLESPDVAFTPGDVFGYLALLEQRGYLKIDGQVLRLSGDPELDGGLNLKSGRSGVMSASFLQLETDDRLLLESAAHVGFKFDADILSAIWKRDILSVIRQLERLEKAGFVKDLHEEDNLFSFKDKEIHRIIRTHEETKGEDIDEGVRQLVIEYQKRIIQSIASKGDTYIASLDLDILQSTISRCFKYSKIDMIRNYTPLIGLYTSLKYVQGGKPNKAADILLRIYPMMESINETHLKLFSRIMDAAVSGAGNLGAFDQKLSGTSVNKYEIDNKAVNNQTNFLDDILKRAQGVDNKDVDAYEKLVLAVLLDAFRRRRISDTALQAAFVERRSRISRLKGEFTTPENVLRLDFYLELPRETASMETLNMILTKSLEAGHYNLAGEIARHLSFLSFSNPELRLKYAILSLCVLAGRQSEIKSDGSVPDMQSAEIRGLIEEMFAKENLASRKA
ncbi:MAG: hypothetical protein ACKO9S_02115, partial [Bacteroidota bacterium]